MESEWRDIRLSAAVNLIGGGTPKRTVPEYWNGSIPWLSVKDFNNDCRHVDKTEETITELGLAKSSTKILEKGQLIISARGTVGALAQLSTPMAFNQSCYGIDAKPEYVTNDFLFYLIKYSIVNFRQITHGAVFDTITRETFDHISVKIPPLSKQRVIAHILGSLDDKIEVNRRMNQTLEATARAIFKSWFVDFLPVRAKQRARTQTGDPVRARRGEPLCSPNHGLPDDIAVLFPASFEDSELGEIPKGWAVSTIGENAEKLTKGTTPRKNDILSAQDTPSIPFLKVRNISDEGDIDLSNLDKVPRSIHEGFLKRSILMSNDVLFSIAGTIGRVAILPEELDDSNANQAIAFVRPKKNELPATFIRLILISDKIQYEASSRVVQGVQANVSLTVLSELKFAKPPQSIIDIWLRYFGDSFSRQELLVRESRTLSALRDTLLPKLISGELRVPDAEKFIEPACAGTADREAGV